MCPPATAIGREAASSRDGVSPIPAIIRMGAGSESGVPAGDVRRFALMRGPTRVVGRASPVRTRGCRPGQPQG